MTGVILAAIVGFALAFALIALNGDAERPAAERTPRRHDDDLITREEVKALLDEYMKDVNYEWNEWYEKFDKLHLRLAKRDKRRQQQPEEEPELFEQPEDTQPGVLQLRRIGSV